MQDKLGTHFITGLEGITLEEHEKKLLEEIQPLGLIFFARNFDSPSNNPAWKETFITLIREAKEASQGSIKILSIDYEGGRVHRFPDIVKKFPYARDWQKESSKTALEMKDILKSFSLNMTYSPVLDVDLETSNPVIGARSFSSEPEKVIKSANDFFQVMEQERIITCGKHFPGHGRTTSDSHQTLPVVNCERAELETDLAPFRALIKNGIPSLMSAHVMYPCLDNTYPASLSKKILTDLLREELGFTGVLFTDDLDMKALSHFDSIQKIKLALEASTDIMLVGNGMEGKSLKTIQEIIRGISPHVSALKPALEKSQERIGELVKNYK